MNRMDITIYVKWSCNLEHPEKAEQKMNSKANSEFKTIYGKDWKMISGKHKLYIWYFELSST